MPEKNIVRFTARLPEDLYEALKKSADFNKRSVAKEIEFILEKVVKEGELDNQYSSKEQS